VDEVGTAGECTTIRGVFATRDCKSANFDPVGCVLHGPDF